MKARLHQSLLVIILLLGAPLCGNAQAPLETTESAAKTPAPKKPAAANPVAEDAEVPGQESPTGAPDKTNRDSPFDYRSSEEISEDLSVSFPVDI